MRKICPGFVTIKFNSKLSSRTNQSHVKGKWIEEFDERFSPMGKRYFWLTGKFIKDDESKDADQNILNENYISVVPVNFDLTSYSHVNHIDKLLND